MPHFAVPRNGDNPSKSNSSSEAVWSILPSCRKPKKQGSSGQLDKQDKQAIDAATWIVLNAACTSAWLASVSQAVYLSTCPDCTPTAKNAKFLGNSDWSLGQDAWLISILHMLSWLLWTFCIQAFTPEPVCTRTLEMTHIDIVWYCLLITPENSWYVETACPEGNTKQICRRASAPRRPTPLGSVQRQVIGSTS